MLGENLPERAMALDVPGSTVKHVGCRAYARKTSAYQGALHKDILGVTPKHEARRHRRRAVQRRDMRQTVKSKQDDAHGHYPCHRVPRAFEYRICGCGQAGGNQADSDRSRKGNGKTEGENRNQAVLPQIAFRKIRDGEHEADGREHAGIVRVFGKPGDPYRLTEKVPRLANMTNANRVVMEDVGKIVAAVHPHHAQGKNP